MSLFLWSIVIFDVPVVIFGGLLVLVAFRFSTGLRSSRAWRAMLSIFSILLIAFPALAFALLAYGLWFGSMMPDDLERTRADPVTYLDYLKLAVVCSAPVFVGIALGASAFRIARRPKYNQTSG
jgi:glucose-6-phosphate-specific signal transduction histidine kinase